MGSKRSDGAFESLWGRIVESLRPDGRFAGQLFGPHDQWAGSGVVVHGRDELERLLEPFTVERLDEFEGDGSTVAGKPKHWHIYHLVARKR